MIKNRATVIFTLLVSFLKDLRMLTKKNARLASSSIKSISAEKVLKTSDIQPRSQTLTSTDLKTVDKIMKKKLPIKKPKPKISPDDPKYQSLIWDILDLYGYPFSSESCLCKQEKIMYFYGLMAVVYALKRDYDLTEKSLGQDHEYRAEFFCKSYFETFGHHAIPTEEETKIENVYEMLKTGESLSGKNIKGDQLVSQPDEEN